jgi:hypothetical protein
MHVVIVHIGTRFLFGVRAPSVALPHEAAAARADQTPWRALNRLLSTKCVVREKRGLLWRACMRCLWW